MIQQHGDFWLPKSFFFDENTWFKKRSPSDRLFLVSAACERGPSTPCSTAVPSGEDLGRPVDRLHGLFFQFFCSKNDEKTQPE